MGVRIVRNFTCDYDFMTDVYSVLLENGYSEAEILILYNEYWADEARALYNWNRHKIPLDRVSRHYPCRPLYTSDMEEVRILKLLSPRQREIVLLKAIGNSQKEIAKKIGVSGAAVSKQFAVIRRVLRDHCLARHLISG